MLSPWFQLASFEIKAQVVRSLLQITGLMTMIWMVKNVKRPNPSITYPVTEADT